VIAPDGARRTSTGKPDEIEKLMSGLGRGCRKSAEFGNSPTPYSTARTVLRGGGRSNAISLPDYVFGRHQEHRRLGHDGEVCTRSVRVPPEAWPVVIHDHHAGYIGWDQFLANRRRLDGPTGRRPCCPVRPGKGSACSRA
jgi:hypothetical protein